VRVRASNGTFRKNPNLEANVLTVTALTALILAVQQQPAQQAPLPESPVKRIEFQAPAREVVAGDSMRIQLRALDASGQEVKNAVVSVNLRGGSGEGGIKTSDPAGPWLIASSVGKFPLQLSAIVPGSKPFLDTTVVVLGVAGPATRIVLDQKPSTLVVGQSLRLAAVGYSKDNDRTTQALRWSSSNPAVATVDRDGFITALAAGNTRLTAASGSARVDIPVRVMANTIAKLTVTPAKKTVRQGDVVDFKVDARDAAGKAINVTPTWTFSPGDAQLGADGKFVPYREGTYTITAIVGNRAASTTVTATDRDVRRSVTVVGRLPREKLGTSEVWIHPNGRVAYLGTHMGGDRLYAIDISNPASPVVTDSLIDNMRLTNDMQTTSDAKYMVFSREGAADRKNGIVIADISDPLHPKKISDFTDGVTSGVHSIYIYDGPNSHRYVYLTNDGTGAIDIVDMTDAAKPVRAGTWKTARPDQARYVHDLDIENGLMYASYWNDGLVVLDIGNGKWGGTPAAPKLVSQFKYQLDSLYKDVEDVSRMGFTRGTHTAWRQRNGGKYVFIADEVYMNGQVKGAKDESASRMYGTLQVIDVSDIENPKSVAWYTPENGGAHNVWQAGDTLYIGAYDGGFRVFDISGELKGDLRAQGREMASLSTADMTGFVKNQAMTWGVVVNPKDGLAYVNDFYNGLWIVRVNPKTPKPVL
jgi:hypothetical protein